MQKMLLPEPGATGKAMTPALGLKPVKASASRTCIMLASARWQSRDDLIGLESEVECVR